MKFRLLLMRTILRLFGARIFSKGLLKAQQSKAYGVFCQKVYGRDLCQFNMLDEEQLQKLLAVLNLNKSHSVLDLGCGIGVLSEYIGDLTGATVTGIDFATGAIESAKIRTANKCDRVRFLVGNLNSLPETLGTFDCVIAIDTLYFTRDLGDVVQQIKRVLKPSGQFAAFYSFKIDPKESVVAKSPVTSKLGMALTAASFDFQAWDFAANEKRIWEATEMVAEELKDLFIEEGNAEIYKGRIKEAKRNRHWIDQGIMSRHLYHAVSKRS